MDLPAICRILHLSDSLTLGQRLGVVGPNHGGSGMKGMQKAGGADLSQHPRYKHVMSGQIEGFKYREGRCAIPLPSECIDLVLQCMAKSLIVNITCQSATVIQAFLIQITLLQTHRCN